MAIENLQKTTLNDFRAGRRTSKNLANMLPESSLVMSDAMLLGDGNVRKRKGYMQVMNIGSTVQRIFDYQRQSDLSQWLLLHYGVNLVPDPDGTAGSWANSTPWVFSSTGGGSGSGGKWTYTGTGSSGGVQNIVSLAFPVVPGLTYTFSFYLNGTHITAGAPFVTLATPGPLFATEFGGITFTSSMNGRQSTPVTIPAGVNSIVVLVELNGATVASGQPLVFSNPQLEAGSTLSPYSNTKVSMTKNDGSAGLTVLTATESAAQPFAFATGPQGGLYFSNGTNVYAEYNVSGTETLWTPIQAPPTAPSISLTTGTLTLQFGRNYFYCYVSKWADNMGTAFVHVGPPSPMSANSGPCTNKVVNLTSIVASTNPRVTHIWIFSSTDLAQGQAGAFIFNGEITNGTTSYGDSNTVAQLDATRSLPVDNLPSPAYKWAVEYQGRIAVMGIPSDPAAIYCSGLEEVDLGIPQELFPSEVRFRVPGKAKVISGGVVYNQTLMVGTPDMWFQVTGFDANTFQKTDDIIEPGPVGFQAVDVIQNQMVWMGKDKKLWSWNFSSAPVDLSAWLGQPLLGLRSMQNISDALLPNVVVRGFDFGRFHLIFVGVSTDGGTGVSWLQAWDASSLMSATGFRGYLSDGSLVGLAESDFNFAHRMFAFSNVLVGNTKYMFFGDAQGNIFRWPDGPLCDAGVANITGVQVSSNVATVACKNAFIVGKQVTIAGLTGASFLNGQTLTVASQSPTQFTASFTHANYGPTSDSGMATGNLFAPQWGSVWLNHRMPGVVKKNLWVDLATDRTDALGKFLVSAISTDGVNMNKALIQLPTQAKYSPYGTDPTMVRGQLNTQPGTAVGEFVRVLVTFPSDTLDATLHQIEVSAQPLAQQVP